MAASSTPKKLVANQTDFINTIYADSSIPTLSPALRTNLQNIVDNVLDALGCIGVIATTLEADGALPIRAFSFNVPSELVQTFQSKIATQLLGARAIIRLDDRQCQDNLAVRSIVGEDGQPEKFLVSDDLYDVFFPVVKKDVTETMQALAQIKQVIAVPFFSDDQVVGTLLAAAGQEFSLRDIDFLTAFGHQAATALETQRRLEEIEALERVLLTLQTRMTDETQTLQTIVDAVVQRLHYAGAMVATFENDNALPVRAYCFDVAPKLVSQLESRAGLSILGPKAVVYLDDERFKENLSIRAIKGRNGHPERFLLSDRLHDLFRPIVNKPVADFIQKVTGIKQVIAVPFFLEDEVVGNLFVATRRPSFSRQERELLARFGQQAAVGLRNARLYKIAEERRQIAQMFGKMAFSATANIHALRNHIGAFQTYMKLVELAIHLPHEKQLEILDTGPNILNHINEAAEILDNLHEPWRQAPDVPTNVNDCLNWAVRKVFRKIALNNQSDTIDTGEGITVERALADSLPMVHTSADMLVEAFRVLIKNAVEAIHDKRQGDTLWLTTEVSDEGMVHIVIRDNGNGIRPEDMSRIFDLGWSSKKGRGMGFGLFWTKDYVEGLGGTITVESTWKEGTVFSIKLPAVRTDAH